MKEKRATKMIKKKKQEGTLIIYRTRKHKYMYSNNRNNLVNVYCEK